MSKTRGRRACCDFGPVLLFWFLICEEAVTGEEKFLFKDVGLDPDLFLGCVLTGVGKVFNGLSRFSLL